MCENLKDTYPFIQLKFSVYGHMQTYTRQAMQLRECGARSGSPQLLFI